MATRDINGIAVEFSDQGLQAVDRLIAETEKVEGEVAALKVQLADSTKAKDKIQGEFDAQKAAQLTDVQIEVMVTERQSLYDQARKLFPEIKTAGKTPNQIKREVIAHVDTTKTIALNDDTTAEYVDGVFATFAAKAPDTSSQSMRGATQHADSGNGDKPDPAGDAQREFQERNEGSWKFGQKEGAA